jgi:uncharacterized protein YqgQ
MKHLLKMLKICLPIILIFIGLLLISFSMKHKMNLEMSEHGKVLYKFVAKTGDKLAKKYGSPFGIGGGAKKDGIWLMALSFQRHGDPLNEEQSRKLIINCINDFLDAVNNDEQLKPFLKEYPFTVKNLDLTIYNYDKNQILYRFPYIAIVTNIEDKIGFFTKDESVKCGYYTKKYETYDEAIAILKKQNKIDHSDEPTEGTTEKPPQDNKYEL